MADKGIDAKAIAALAAALDAKNAPKPTIVDELGRAAAMTGRYAAQGLAGIGGLVYDPIAYAQNKLIGPEGVVPLYSENVQPLREQVSSALTSAGVPQPSTPTERVVGAISEGAVGGGGMAAAAKGISKLTAAGAKFIADQLAAQMGAQVAGGAGSGAGAQTAAELGAGPVTQFIASLAGGALGGRAATTTAQAVTTKLPPSIAEAEKAGVRVMTSDVLPPTTFATRWLQRAGEMIPYAGTGGPRAAQQKERIDASADLLRNYGAVETAAGENAALLAVSKDLLTRRKDDLTKYTGMKGEVIERLSTPKTTVDVSRAVSQIDKEIARLNGISETQFKPVVDRLMTWRDDLTGTKEVTLPNGNKQVITTGQPLATVEILRKQIGESFSDPTLTAVRSEAEKVLSRIYSPLREDMGEFIKANGQRRDYDKWNIANKQLSVMAGELELGVLKNSLAKGEATPETIRTMLFSAKPSDVKALYRGLSAEGKRNARTAVMQEAFNKVGGSFENLSPDQFKRQLVRLGSPIGVFFSGEDLRAVEGLVRTLKLTERGAAAGVSPPTGVQAVPVVGAALLADFLGSSGAAIVGGTTIGGLARAYESAAVRNLLLKIPQVAVGSPEEAELTKRLIEAIQAQTSVEEK